MKSLAVVFLHHKDCFCDCQGSRLETSEPDVQVHSLGGSLTNGDAPLEIVWQELSDSPEQTKL